uniref:Leucine-rich alpha-2-glycoprotein-like n=1 Tax=Scleropages formosus TaxID=113540 RepID=A0A8C9VN60_SCLFO
IAEMKFSMWLLPVVMVVHSKSASYTSLCGKGCTCLGEFRFVNCSDALFGHLPRNVPPFAEHLDLSLNQLGHIPAGYFHPLRRIRVLLLNGNNISALADGTFYSLQSLQRLDLSRNRISILSAGFSLGLGSLKELLLGQNRLTGLESGSFLYLDGLRRLDLSANAIRTIHVRAFGGMTALRRLHLQDNRLEFLGGGIFSTLRSLEVLDLRGNLIDATEGGVFTPLASLATLDLAHNRLSSIRFRTLLSIPSYSTHILLGGNRWHCDCDLQRVFRKLRSVQRLFLDDYATLSCAEPPELQGYRLEEVDSQLCVAETVTVLIITVTVVITVVAAVVMAEKNRKKRTGVHWSEESDTPYDPQG